MATTPVRNTWLSRRPALTWGLLAALGLLPVGLLGLYADHVGRQSVRSLVQAGNRTAARMAAEVVRRELENTVTLAVSIGRAPGLVAAVERHDERAVREQIATAVLSHPRIDRTYVLDRDGLLWSDFPQAPESLGQNFAYRDYYRGLARSWEPYVSEVFQRKATPQPLVVAVAAPIRDRRGKVLGGVVCQLRLELLTHWLKQCTVGKNGYVFVVDHRGHVAAHPQLDLQAEQHDEYAAVPPIEAALRGTASTQEYDDPAVDKAMIATFLPVSITGNHWVVVAQQPVAEAYAPIRNVAVQLGLATGILALVTIVVALMMGQTQWQLQRARLAAEAASLAKGTFLANMSHEIRTPLNAIIGMTELVMKYPLPPQQREFLQTVRDSGEALLAVINDILDFSKIEAGKLLLDRNPFDLRESLGDTMKSFAIRAHQQNLELAYFVHPEVPRHVVGDYGRLRQIVVNLVGNALKFTEQGEVSLEVEQQSRSPHDVCLHFTVSDTGIGIPPDKQAAIFESFEQADASTTRRHGGTGLGLAISSRLVALMDGKLWLDSTLGRGSRFHFTVHLGLDEEKPAEPLAAEPTCLHEMRVLVVDDNATNRRILEEQLRSWRMSPSLAADAAAAIEMLQAARQAGQPYRLVLTDSHMPDVDGFALARQIKDDAAFGGTVIMMLTSGDCADDAHRCNELGIAGYLLKPIKESELLEAIESAVGVRTLPCSAAPAAAPQRHRRGLRILLAEDSLVNQRLAVALLEAEGHCVTVAGNGHEAVAASAAHDFDLILMDVQMPEMDGFEATAAIRAQQRQAGRHTPIVAMTAHALKGDAERCLAAGMDAYVAKPIHATELFTTIDSVCGAPPVDYVDWPAALKAMKGNRKLLSIAVDAAIQEHPRLLAEIGQAVAAGDAAALRLAAHTLKGSIRYFGATPAFGTASELERLAEAGDMRQAAAVWPTLEQQMAPIATALAAYRDPDRPSAAPPRP